MRANLAVSLRLSTKHEGGYSNHPSDPGGPTNHGITQVTLSAWRKRKVSISEVKALTKAEAEEIYIANYWAPVGGDKLPAGLDYAMFDYGINSGPAQAVKELQRIVGVAPDGVFGPKTLEAVEKFPKGIETLIRLLCAARLAFMKKLSTWSKFGRGWTIRVTGVDPQGKYKQAPGVVGEALKIAAGRGSEAAAASVAAAEVAPSAKARTSDIRTLAPTRNKVQATAIAASVAAFAADTLEKLTPYQDTFEYIKYGVIALSIVAGVSVLYMNVQKLREAGAHA